MKIKYLSDLDKDYKCLEQKIKEGIFGDTSGKDVIAYTQSYNAIQSVLENHEEFEKYKIDFMNAIHSNTLPTRYDSILLHSIVKDLIKTIQKAAKELKIEVENFPLYATIPTGLVNARVLKLDCSTKDFIIFDSEIFSFCHLFSKAFSLCIPHDLNDQKNILSFSLGDVEEHIHNNIDVIYRLKEALHATCYEEPTFAEQYFIDERHSSLSSNLMNTMELFIVGHEYAHVFRKHHMLDHTSEFESPPFTEDKSISDNHAKEFEADFTGLFLTITAQQKTHANPLLTILGCYLYFCAIDLKERYDFFHLYNTFNNFKYKDSDTHPSNIDRRKAIKYCAKDLLNHTQILDDIDQVIDLIWRQIVKESCWSQSNT